LLVVRTDGITEASGAPRDAVVEYSYWHPGDRDWVHGFGESVDAIVADLSEGHWHLVQRQDLDNPYRAELVFETEYHSFFGPTGKEIMEQYGWDLGGEAG
jgi:hypothetical protein